MEIVKRIFFIDYGVGIGVCGGVVDRSVGVGCVFGGLGGGTGVGGTFVFEGG